VRLPAALPLALFAILALGLSACSVPASPQAPPAAPILKAADFAADFDQFWSEIADSYGYFDEKKTDWAAVRERHGRRAGQVRERAEFVALLEDAIDELYDAHASLRTNTAHSFRLVPTGADIWAETGGGRALVKEVRTGSAAARAGVRAGQEIVAIRGVPVAQAIDARVGASLRAPDPAARDWALRSLLAGRRDEPRSLSISAPEGAREIRIDSPKEAPQERPLEARRLEAAVGYIRLHNNLGDDDLVPAFDAALAELAACPALILDLRDTPSGGNTGVAEALMGRFVRTAQPYQKYVLPKGGWRGRDREWVQYVTPRGPFTYEGKLIVLVDHWTGSMGEGMAIGFDGMGRGAVVGTSMAGLNGANESSTLAKTGIGFAYPAERLFHIDGTPRHRWQPKVSVDMEGQDAEGKDPILERGLARIHDGEPRGAERRN
jgi:C-terminal processing protease CtpA/Prc